MLRKILAFAANPIGTSQPRWDDELFLIKKILDRTDSSETTGYGLEAAFGFRENASHG
jgi:hypothetical protein